MSSPRAAVRAQQEPYVRTRENPFFNGLLRGDAGSSNQGLSSEQLKNAEGPDLARSISDIRDSGRTKFGWGAPERTNDSPGEDSSSDFVFEPPQRSSSARWSKNPKPAPFSFPTTNQSDLNSELLDLAAEEEEEQQQIESPRVVIPRPSITRSFMVSQTSPYMPEIPLSMCAASFYLSKPPIAEIAESCASMKKLNLYLKKRRDDVSAGIPGKFLHVVMSQGMFDVGSFALTILYAYYLHETGCDDEYCTVPVINMKRAELNSHGAIKWLISSCQIDEESLIFVDEIDLSYYDLFGSLKLVLLSSQSMPAKQEPLKDAVIEVMFCRKGDSEYPFANNVTSAEDSSCCSLLAEKFAATYPEILGGPGFSQLLLSGILLDTENLSHPQCTLKDKYMASLLIKGAGRFGMDGLYQILRYKMHDISDLRVADILQKDFKKWTIVGPEAVSSRSMASHVGTSSVGIPLSQLLSPNSRRIKEIKRFQQIEKLRLLVIVSGYYDAEKDFKRELLVSAESTEFLMNILQFFNDNSSQLPLRILPQPGLKEEMKAFEIDKFTSRKNVERLLEEFCNRTKGTPDMSS
ncbi:hypothetical protein MLD38_037265 [Melastoma candidum]|uniref:Uncharacterized protein n=1 Tax=Melastoma candidum TaxID=119954 RepID=A0ACB9LMQ9_9MYRT|nr:hypothetical protein MLD38_037265 [Melastoma candidum]